ncbi:Srm1 protein [Myxozyma melibiosi]|uniref:Srm1 protein n=1 Tax=Myxozyma melibiosi TaxID=54550 RepID=A0ABR1F2T6_9ASCO
MAPAAGRKRKQPHDDEPAATAAPAKRQQKTPSTKPPAPVPARRGGRKRDSLTSSSSSSSSASSSVSAKGSIKADSVLTTITEPDSQPIEDTQVDVDPEEKKEAATTNGTKHEPAAPKPYKLRKVTKEITPIPALKSVPLNVYVFGTGSMAELGLGPEAKTKEVKRPRLNPFLPIDSVSIVDFAVGGAHVLALDKDGKIWSWGCNDHGTLGRNTSQGEEGLLRDMDAEDDDDDDGDLNPLESTPAKVTGLPDDLVFVQVAASDSLSLALTSEGRVWAWGTFRHNEGILGFNEDVMFQREPVQVRIEFPVSQIAAGKDHVMALTTNGKVYTWGNGQQFQLGHRVLDRYQKQALQPREIGIRNIKYIGSGEFHSFAIDTQGRVLAWGLNQFGQCGIPSEGAGEDGAVVTEPTYINAFDGKNIISITAGEHHSVALSAENDMYTFGRIDSSEIGIEKDELPDTAVKDDSGRPRFLPVPTKVALENEDGKVKYIACGSHHNIALASSDGSAWTWGFGETYQCGQGPAGEDVEIPTKIENTATQGVNMLLAGAGGQFSVIGGLKTEAKEEK